MRFEAACIVAFLVLLPAARLRAAESCVTCHPEARTEFEASVHAKQYGCTACHGGDAAATGPDAHAVDKGWIGKPARNDIPRLCATCHADPARMRPFRLPTDQLTEYQTSQHGQRLAQGDDRVAVCTDCHGVHRIVAGVDPASPVAPRNVPATCGRCHADAALMASYKLPADSVEQFRGSVHGVALFVDEHPAAPTCSTCHGAHGANTLDGGSIAAACGRCHGRTAEYLNDGPHRPASAAADKRADCVACHGYHDTKRPDQTLFATACPSCHAAGSSALATGEKLRTLLGQADEALDTASQELDSAAAQSPTLVRYRPRLVQGRAYLMEALPVQHSLAVERVADLTRSARSVADQIRAGVHGATQDERLRYLWLAAAWLYIAFTLGVAYLYRQERRGASHGTARRDG